MRTAPLLILAAAAHAADPVPFNVKLETLAKSTDPGWQWFHPRVAWSPDITVMTLQRHLTVSDYYSGLYTMTTTDNGATWSGPSEIPELGWTRESDQVDVAVADVTPNWHPATGKIIAVGAQVRYSKQGRQLDDRKHSHQTAYAVFDTRSKRWSRWKTIAMPDLPKFNFARSACAQWLALDDGTILLPFYFGPNAKEPRSVTVARFRFDGSELTYLSHGTEFHLKDVRGLVEPSIIRFRGRFYLTIRNDLRGYVAASDDGLNYDPMRPWQFDDGGELGSYNTQQHWLASNGALYLSYTRKGANNDHVFRHRAPLFMAQVDPATLRVLRATEKVLMPERGATFGNFGAAKVGDGEWWVTDVEGMFGPEAKKRGADGSLYLARVTWPGKPPRVVSRSMVYQYPNRDPYDPANKYGFNHAANVSLLGDGRLMACWFSGPFEASVHQAVLCNYSADRGTKWSKAEVLSDFPRRSDFDPAFIADTRRTWLFFSAGRWNRYPFIANESVNVGVRSFQIYQRHSDDAGKAWSATEAAQVEPGFNCRNNGIRLATGELLLPVAKLGNGNESGVLKSGDGGRTWKRFGRISTPMGQDEPAIVETSTGAVLMYLRTGGGTLWRTVSRDKGETWSQPARTDIVAARSSHSLFRLRDGRLALTHDASTSVRTPITMRLSSDDGESWDTPAVLAEAPQGGPSRRQVSYPSVAQLADASLIVVYSDIGISDGEQYGDIRSVRVTLP
jgi:hypothetical protein